MADDRSRWRAWLDEYGSLLMALGVWLFILYHAMFGVARQ
jgi:hypothetical protein